MSKTTKTVSSQASVPESTFLTDAEFHRRCEEGRARVRRMTVAQKRKLLIGIGALNADGTVRHYDLSDHVPLGPRH